MAASSRWTGLFDPMDPMLWVNGTDCVWVRGEAVMALESRGALARAYPWMVSNRAQAEAMVRANQDTVVGLVEALLSWRTVDVAQLRSGLCRVPLPVFDRDRPSLYGALARLGLVSVGFSYLDSLGVPSERVFLSLGGVEKLNRSVLRLLDVPSWVRSSLEATGRLYGRRQATLHNILAAHTGLAFLNDSRCMAVGGDGLSGFNLVDPVARKEADVAFGAADCVAVANQGAMCAVEVQRTGMNVRQKAERWARLLAASPMSRRGLICVWLFPKSVKTGEYAPRAGLSAAASLPEMTVGIPMVSARMGFALWDDWFEKGVPSERFGSYTDMLGVERSVFDLEGPVVDPVAASHWGDRQVDDWVGRVFHVDMSRFRHPASVRGGLGGLIVKGVD